MRDGPPGGGVLSRYQSLLARFAETETIEELGTTPLGDETLAVILARVVGDIYLRWHGRSRLPNASVLPTSGAAYDAGQAELARAHDPALGVAFHAAAVRTGAHAARPPAADRAVRGPAVRPVSHRGHRRRSRRPVSRRRDRGRGGRRRLFPAADAVAARDEAPARRAAILDRRVRFGRDTGQRRCAAAQRARPRRRRVPAEGAVRRSAVLRPRTAERGVAPAALHPRRRQRLHAWRARGVRARAGAGAGEEAVAGRGQERRRLGPLLRQPAAPAHRSRPVGAPRSAALAQLPFAARPKLRARVRRSGGRGRPPGARRKSGRRGHVHHARHLSDSGRHDQGAGGAGPAVRHLRVAVGPAGARLPAVPAQEPGRDRDVAGAHRREAPARAGDRRGRREASECRPRNRSRPASGPSRRSARGGRARRWSFIASCSNTTRPRAATTRRGSTGRRRPTSRSAAGARPATCC